MNREEAWAAVAAGEDAALYTYSVAGAQLTARERASAVRGRDEHVRLRDAAALNAPGVAPAPAYAVDLSGGDNPTDAAKAALASVELALVALYAQAAAQSTQRERRAAARIATQCAMRATRWGAPPEAFPE